MRYGIVEHHEDGDDSPHPYFVVDSQAPSMGEGMLGPKFSKAEAEILAFALTGVAGGGVLCLMEPGILGDLFTQGYRITAYDGSTEGVF